MSKNYILKRDVFNNRKTIHHVLFDSDSPEGQLIANFFIDAHSKKATKDWLKDDNSIGLSKGHIEIDKRDNLIVFSSCFDKRENKFEFAITREVFLKILNEWDIAKNSDAEYIIIDVEEDGQDVTIFAMDDIFFGEEHARD
jgi:hypothetical protein